MNANLGLRLPRMNLRSLALLAGAAFAVLVVSAAAIGALQGSREGDTSMVLPMTTEPYAVGGGAGGFPGMVPGAAPSNEARTGALASERAAKDAAGMQGVTSSASSAPSAPGGGVDLPSLDSVRPIIRTGSVDITVKSVSEAFDQVRLIATQSGGLVSDSTFAGSSKQGFAQLTLRVPGDRFGDVVTKLRDMAIEVQTISTGSQDVADQLTDLEATLRNLRAVEARYLVMLDQAKNISEILQVQDRVNQVRMQIDRTEARRQLINGQVEMSTLSVTLRPEGAVTGAPKPMNALERVQAAWSDSLEGLQTVATAVLVGLVYSWWVIVLVVAAVLGIRRFGRTTPAAPPVAAPPAA